MIVIEKYLKEYNEYKTKIRLLEIEIDDSISVGSKSDDPLPGRVSARSNVSVVERQAREIQYIQDEIRELKKLMNKIDEVVNTLSKDEQEFIHLRYFEGITMYQLSIKYHTHLDTMYKRKDVILNKLESYSNYVLN